MDEENVRFVHSLHIVHAFVIVLPFLLMAGFGYGCARDGCLNPSGSVLSNTGLPSANSSVNSSANVNANASATLSELRNARSVVNENSILLNSIATWIDSNAEDESQDFIQDVEGIVSDKESDVLSRAHSEADYTFKDGQLSKPDDTSTTDNNSKAEDYSITYNHSNTDGNSKADDNNTDNTLHDKEAEVVRRVKRRGGGGRGGGRGRGSSNRYGRTGFGGGSGGPTYRYCGANYYALIVVGCIFIVLYLLEVCLIYTSLEYLRYIIISACALECILYYIYMGVMFHISTYDDKDQRKRDGLILVIFSSILYSLRSALFIMWGWRTGGQK